MAKVFDCTDSKQMVAGVARFAVLLEDLRLEVLAMYHEPLSDETKVDYKVQQIYFFRKIVGTLLEIVETLRMLDQDLAQSEDFNRLVKSRFDSRATKLWTEAIQFFTSNKPMLEKVRNDVGGHFGHSAAIFAVTNMNPTAVGKVEILEGKVKLHFVNEIAATALLRHTPGSDVTSKFEYLGKLALTGLEHARNAMGLIVFGYLWERFGH